MEKEKVMKYQELYAKFMTGSYTDEEYAEFEDLEEEVKDELTGKLYVKAKAWADNVTDYIMDRLNDIYPRDVEDLVESGMRLVEKGSSVEEAVEQLDKSNEIVNYVEEIAKGILFGGDI